MEWVNAKKQNPCPICGKPDWCFMSKDGLFVGCRRIDTGEGKHKIDKAGADYWVYNFGTNESFQEIEFEPGESEPERTDLETLNKVYQALIKKLNLSSSHKNNLIERGLKDEEIQKRQYCTLPLRGRAQKAKELIEKFGKDTCSTVPGFIQKKGKGTYWTLSGSPGILIPLRDTKGKIKALKVRRDDDDTPKYLYISSRKKDYKGPGPGANVHIPIFEGNTSTVILTEGELKADIITSLSNILAISIPGVSCWRQAIPVLEQLEVKTVRLAFDADVKSNKFVAQALYNTWKELRNDYNVELITWDEEKGKGLDDLLAVGEKPEILEGQEADKTLVDMVKKAYEVDPPQNNEQLREVNMEKVRQKVEETIEKLQEKPKAITFYQDTKAHEALAALSTAEQAAYREKIKQICPEINVHDMKKAIKEAGGQGKKKKNFFSGLFQQHGCYYIEVDRGDGNGTIQTLSNFVLEPREKIITPDGTERLYVDVFMGNDEEPVCQRTLTTGDLLGRRELLRALGSVSAQWLGNDYNVQQLIGYLAEKDVNTKKGAPILGHFQGRFITPYRIITREGEEENSKFTYMPQNVVFENYIEMPKSDNWKELAKKVLRLLPRLQDPTLILPIIGWFFAAPAAPIIRKKWNEFPIMHVWGTAGGGKTSLLQTFLNLLGVTADPFSAQMKQFSLIKTMASTNALPVFLDEYRPLQFSQRQLQQLHELLLLAYKSSIESRGKPDQSTVEYPLHSPIILAGEAPLPENENGLGERVVQLRFDRNYLDKHLEAVEAFKELSELELTEFAQGYIQFILNLDFSSFLDTFLKETNRVLEGHRIPIRVKHNIAVIFAGIWVYKKLVQQLDVEDVCKLDEVFEYTPKGHKVTLGDKIINILSGIEDTNNQEPTDAIDRFMLSLEAMAHSGDIINQLDYELKKDNTLAVYTNSVIAKYNKWAKLRDLEKVNDRSFKIQVKEKAETLTDYVITHSRKVRIGDKSIKAMLLDAKKLEDKLGISIDTWDKKPELTEGSRFVDAYWDDI